MGDTSVGLVPESTGPKARVQRHSIGGIDVDEQIVASSPLTFLKDDTTTAGYTYLGEALPGTATSAASWRIARVNGTTDAVYYASTGDFNQIWDNRASLSYA